jgi:hypothetical protein
MINMVRYNHNDIFSHSFTPKELDYDSDYFGWLLLPLIQKL